MPLRKLLQELQFIKLPGCFKNGTINEVLNDPVAEELEKNINIKYFLPTANYGNFHVTSRTVKHLVQGLLFM